jgi:hypothetical protein
MGPDNHVCKITASRYTVLAIQPVYTKDAAYIMTDATVCYIPEGYYEYVDGSVGGAGQTGYLMSPVLPSSTKTCLIFYFNIFVSYILTKKYCR